MVDIFCYCIEHDRGLAPNPFFNVCSLAVCKPDWREAADVGDYVIGTSSHNRRKGGIGGRPIYVMRVTEKMEFDRYWNDSRFRRKRPKMAGTRIRRCGDNIYHRDPVNDAWIQEDSMHRHADGRVSQGDLDTDTSADAVLLSTDYTYWGTQAPTLPPQLDRLGRKYARQRRHLTQTEKTDFLQWVGPLIGQGLVGMPIDWRK